MDTRSLILYIVAAALTAAVLTSPVACTVHRQRIIAAAIKDGADPIAAKCAIEGETQHSTLCALAALKGGAK